MVHTVGATAEGVAATTAAGVRILDRREGTWTTLPSPSPWGMIRSQGGSYYSEPPFISLLRREDGLHVLLAGSLGSYFWIGRDGGDWRYVYERTVGGLRVPGPWFHDRNVLAQWDGGQSLHPRALPDRYGDYKIEPDPGTPTALWIKDKKTLFYLPGPDARLLKVLTFGQARARSAGAVRRIRELLESENWRRGIRDRKGDFWFPVEGGVVQVPSKEAIAGRRLKVNYDVAFELVDYR